MGTEGGTQEYFQLRNQSGDRRRWKLLTICVSMAKSHVGEVKESSGKDKRVFKGELDTTRGFCWRWTPQIEQAIIGTGSWNDWMKAWLIECKDEWWWWTTKREKEGSINTNFTHSRGSFLPVCVLLLYFSPIWPIWEIGISKAHPKWHCWSLFQREKCLLWQVDHLWEV